METENTSECQEADALLNDALAESSAGVDTVSREQRLMNALEYQAEALSRESKRDACLGALNAGLARMAIRLEEAIEEALAGGPVTLERIRQIEPVLNDHLRVTRQIDRFAQFEMRVEEKREIAKNGRGKIEMFALQAYAKEAGVKGGPQLPR
jgi:hypothetical protein